MRHCIKAWAWWRSYSRTLGLMSENSWNHVCELGQSKAISITLHMARGLPLCVVAFSFFFSSYYILLPFCLVCLNCHLPLLGPETHSLQACLSLCPSSNRVLSLSIALDIRPFLPILRPLSSTLLFARLPHGNLGEPCTRPTLHSLRIWCCPVATTQRTDCPLPHFLSVFSPTLGLACLLRFEKISFPSTSNGRCSSSFFLELHQTTQYFDLPIFSTRWMLLLRFR